MGVTFDVLVAASPASSLTSASAFANSFVVVNLRLCIPLGSGKITDRVSARSVMIDFERYYRPSLSEECHDRL